MPEAAAPQGGRRVAQPVDSNARLIALDVLRGFALLGILIINIQWFAMPTEGAMNPVVWGDLQGANFAVWLLSHLLAEQKMMAIFSMLFGAGIILFSERKAAQGESAWVWHRRRNLWLLVFGLIHAYLLWYGDILVLYAVCSFIVFPLRNQSPFRLLAMGVMLLAVYSLIYLYIGWSMQFWPVEVRAEFEIDWHPSAEEIQSELAQYRGDWLDQMAHRVPEALGTHTFGFVFWGLWRATGMMLIGMALYRWGVLSAQAPDGVYWRLIAAATFIGLPLVVYGIYWNFEQGWGAISLFYGMQFNHWGSVLVSLGWVSVLALMVRRGLWSGFIKRLAAVGRMAFSNYILHTLICGLIFYGHGLGLIGQVERVGQITIVLGIWMLQLVISPVWLQHFRFGPLEWLWRSLTYHQRQPFGKPASSQQ